MTLLEYRNQHIDPTASPITISFLSVPLSHNIQKAGHRFRGLGRAKATLDPRKGR